ncbi:hypothetical protein SNEBB_002085 [Seison nebaliae]|nr:hypothetical protein SNEBB_002085 [Seison nebaliae]
MLVTEDVGRMISIKDDSIDHNYIRGSSKYNDIQIMCKVLYWSVKLNNIFGYSLIDQIQRHSTSKGFFKIQRAFIKGLTKLYKGF